MKRCAKYAVTATKTITTAKKTVTPYRDVLKAASTPVATALNVPMAAPTKCVLSKLTRHGVPCATSAA